MKEILITGANSYIGTSFEKWVAQWPDKYSVDTVDMIDGSWKEKDFGEYDVVFHVAGIAHIKETNKNRDLYYGVNRDLAYETAKKAKEEGVKQFIFLSTMAVYGTETGHITQDTIPIPKSAYAKSKHEAEELLQEMDDGSFRVAILRPPMVYGKGCKGNYPRLANMALKLPLFPLIENERSMIFVDNLSEFVRLTIDSELNGLLFPQNKDYVNTSELVELIAKAHGKRIKLTSLFNWAVWLSLKFSGTVRKVFGTLTYDKGMVGGPGAVVNAQRLNYDTCSFTESVKRTESKEQ